MANKLPRAVVGWRVYGPVKGEFGDVSVKPISGKFQIRSSADEFLKMAILGAPESADKFYVGTVTKVDKSEIGHAA